MNVAKTKNVQNWRRNIDIYVYNIYICIYMYGTLWVEKLKFGSEDNASARTDLSKKLDEGDSQKKS